MSDNNQYLFFEEKVSYLFIGIFSLLESLFIFTAFGETVNITLIFISLVLLVFFSLFFSIRIVVVHGDIIISYGIGLIKTHLPISLIDSSRIEKNSHPIAWIFDCLSKESVVLNIRNGSKKYLPVRNVSGFMSAIRRR